MTPDKFSENKERITPNNNKNCSKQKSGEPAGGTEFFYLACYWY
jgi:hypothetical protein